MRQSLRAVPWPDLVIAGLLAIAAVASAILESPERDSPARAATVVISFFVAGSVALRTASPLVMAAIAATGIVALALLPQPQTPLWAFVATLVIAFSLAMHLQGWRSALALLLLVTALYVMQARTDPVLVEVVLTPPILVGAPALAGWLLARSRRQSLRLREISAELARERERVASLAASAERARISRDLHDILAHTLSSIAVQSGAAGSLLSPTAPAAALVEHIRVAAGDGLDEVRATLGAQHDDLDRDPRGGLERLPDLAHADGASLQMRRVPHHLPAGVSVAAFRIVQEALTNRRRHAPGSSVAIEVDCSDGVLRVSVVNGPSPGATPAQRSPGRGILGMRERAHLYGGDVEAGRVADDGWRVAAWFPLAAVSAMGGDTA